MSFCRHYISTSPRQLARKIWFLKHTNPPMIFKKTCWFQDCLVWDNKFVVFCTHYNVETNAVHSFHIHWKSELVHQTSGDQSFKKKTLDAKDILKIYCVKIERAYVPRREHNIDKKKACCPSVSPYETATRHIKSFWRSKMKISDGTPLNFTVHTGTRQRCPVSVPVFHLHWAISHCNFSKHQHEMNLTS